MPDIINMEEDLMLSFSLQPDFSLVSRRKLEFGKEGIAVYELFCSTSSDADLDKVNGQSKIFETTNQGFRLCYSNDQ